LGNDCSGVLELVRLRRENSALLFHFVFKDITVLV
jgi:hypothetical protein